MVGTIQFKLGVSAELPLRFQVKFMFAFVRGVELTEFKLGLGPGTAGIILQLS